MIRPLAAVPRRHRAWSPLTLDAKDRGRLRLVPSRQNPGAFVAFLGRRRVAELIVELALEFVEAVILAVEADGMRHEFQGFGGHLRPVGA